MAATKASVKRLKLANSLQYEDTMSYDTWHERYKDQPVMAVYYNPRWHYDTATNQVNWYDWTQWIAEDGLQITHEEFDGSKAGRDVNNARMIRKVKGTKHTIKVKLLDRLPQDVANIIFLTLDSIPKRNKYASWVIYNWPCGNKLLNVGEEGFEPAEMYVASFDYGTQRYSKSDGKIYYYGANFNMVEM